MSPQVRDKGIAGPGDTTVALERGAADIRVAIAYPVPGLQCYLQYVPQKVGQKWRQNDGLPGTK